MTRLHLGLRDGLRISPSRQRGVDPTRISGLAFWYRAGDGRNTITSGAVETAYDGSGNGRHGTTSSGAARPLDITDAEGRTVMRFDGSDDAITVTSPPNLAGGVTVFIAYRVRQHVDGGGIIGAGTEGGGPGHAQFFEFMTTSSSPRTALLAKTAQADPVGTALRVDPHDRNYAVLTITDAGAELRDFLGAVTDNSTPVALATPDTIAIGARLSDQLPTGPHGFIDLYEIGAYTRPLSSIELAQIEAYLRSRHRIGWSPGYLDSALAWWHDHWSDFTLAGSLVAQWADRSGQGRHWTASGAARPNKTIQDGHVAVRFDGVDDVMSLAGSLPALQPFTVALVYRVRSRVDFAGVLSAAAATGVDHTSFWTFELATAVSNNMQLFGRSTETDQLFLPRPDGGVPQVAIWTVNAGIATLRDRNGQVSDSFGGSLATPAAVVLGARYNAAPFNQAAVDVMGTVGATGALATADQLKLIDWASTNWGV